MYKPLPDSVEIRNSSIHGVGLFAKTSIKKGIHLGISHVFAPGFKGDHIRTPVGGFINHSDEPNCFKQESPEESVRTIDGLRRCDVGKEIFPIYNKSLYLPLYRHYPISK